MLSCRGAARSEGGGVKLVSGKQAGQIAVARRSSRVVGCARRLDENTGELGMLVADPAHRGVGVGRDLVIYHKRLDL